MRIIISGAGIGGLTAALCCLQHGHSVTVLERAERLDALGAGIQLPPNAMCVFQALGLGGLFDGLAFQPEALEARMGRSGRYLFSAPLNEATRQRWPAPYLHIHRADYISALRQALDNKAPTALRLGAEITAYRQDEKAVTVKLADGSALEGDVLIGADGIHSTIQEQMLGAQQPRFTGNVAWRATVPVDNLGEAAPPPTACVWMGAGRHCVTYLLRGGKLANFVGVVERDDWTTETWTERGTRAQALADFNGWHKTITGILNRAEAHYCWALFDRAPLARWVDGRVALLGDAAHPMLPFMAQGAAMAVEDAFVLARHLSVPQMPANHRSINAALTSYQAERLGRTARVQAASRRNAKTFHRRSHLSQLAGYGPMWLAGRLSPQLIYQQQDWLYAHDVTR